MKSIFDRVVVGFLLVTLAGAAALAKTKMGMVSFSSNIRVNGTVVRKGDYDVTFDETTGQLSIKKDGKLIAKTAARLEKRDRKAHFPEVQTREAEMGAELISIALGGSDQNIVVNHGGMQAGGGN
jgi:hypothetical protein